MSTAPKRAPTNRITPRALLDIKRLSEPKLHPDGQRVAFVATEADFEESRWVSHLWITEWLDAPVDEAAEPVGAGPAPEPPSEASAGEENTPGDAAEPEDPTRQLTFSHDGEHAPKWSPDGRFLAFLSARPDESEPPPDDEEEDEPKEQLWVLPIDGGEARKVSNALEGVLDYDWMPDSATLVYLAPEARPKPVHAIRKEQRTRKKIDPVVENEERLRRQFWQVDIEDRKPKLLFTSDFGVQEFSVSPDGNRIAFLTNYTGLWNDYHVVDLWIRDLKTATAWKAAERAGGKYQPRWSQDGARVAFLSWHDPKLSYSRETLYAVNVATEPRQSGTAETFKPEPLTPDDFDYDVTDYVWSRHNGHIYMVASVGAGSHLFRIADGVDQLTPEDAVERHDVDADPGGGSVVFVQEDAASPPEIYLQDENGARHCLTKLNSDFAERYRLPRQEVVRWASTEGMEIEGVLTYPLDYREGERYPLVVQIHGGPKGRSANTLQSYCMHPVWAAEGYAVLRPNFRGSEGYGNAFAVANRRDLGGGDFRDIMTGVDWAIEQGIADPQRLGVMGGSYGGYMTNWAIGHTDRFRGAVSMFGVFHLQTDYSNSDLSAWDNDYLGAYYWEDPEIYQRLSPGSYLAQINTPTLILHGDDDNNTFISNSKEMYQALRHRGVTTQFVHYPREGHGLREPHHRLDEMRRCLAWMDRHVRFAGGASQIYRVGDRAPAENGALELWVTHAGPATFIGQPKPVKTEGQPETTLFEVVFTIYNPDSSQPAEPFTLSLDEIALRPSSAAGVEPLRPIGVPMDLPGGKVLVEGAGLRSTQHPDAETGQLAFAWAAAFRVLKSHREFALTIPGFPPVEVWVVPEEEETEPSEKESGK